MKTITENTVQAGQGRMNIKEIARVAGVSPATISRVLNGSGYVKEETKKKVMAAVEKNNYTPSLIARSLSGRDSFSLPQVREFTVGFWKGSAVWLSLSATILFL